jgi:zinc/manganese transport system permease protein
MVISLLPPASASFDLKRPMMTELFLLPFLTGLALAVVLPLVGCYLRLRDEWLAALAYAHVAAAGALVAVLTGLSPLLGGLMAAGAAGAGKRVLSRRLSGGGAFPVLLLAGWAAGVLVTANHPVAERLGNALFDGQLYFAQGEQLSIAVAWGIVALLLLRRLSPHLLLSHVYPDFFRMRGVGAWPVQAGFDLLAALTLALATMSIGVMGCLCTGLHSALAGLSAGNELACRTTSGGHAWRERLRHRLRSGPVA